MVLTSTPLVQWSTLGYIVLYSGLIGIGLVALVSAGVFALSQIQSKSDSAVRTLTGYATLVICNLAIVAVLVWGLYVMLHKS